MLMIPQIWLPIALPLVCGGPAYGGGTAPGTDVVAEGCKASGLPQFEQNCAPGEFGAPHFVQCKSTSCVECDEICVGNWGNHTPPVKQASTRNWLGEVG